MPLGIISVAFKDFIEPFLYGEGVTHNTSSFLKQEFLASTQKMYNAELSSVDFLQASEDARKTINEWVKGQTDGERGRRWPLTGSFLPPARLSLFPCLSA